MEFMKHPTKDGHWENDTYTVQLRPAPYGDDQFHWLSIRRKDNKAIHSWTDMQLIKNAIVGPEYEGFEIFPAETRLVDEANVYHIWVYKDPTKRCPTGLLHRRLIKKGKRMK